MLDVIKDISSSWSDLWRQSNDHCDSYLAQDNHLAHMMDKIFHIIVARGLQKFPCNIKIDFKHPKSDLHIVPKKFYDLITY